MSGSSSQILHMISIITAIFLLLSLQTRTHIAIAEASLTEEHLKLYGLQKFQVEKVAGEDDNERKEALILKKFRALLGIKSFRPRKPMSESFSPSPSPLPAMEDESPAPAPAPELPVSVHYHPPVHHHSNPGPKLSTMKKEDTHRSRFKKILVAVLVSVGAAFVICVLGVTWAYGKFRKNNEQYSKSVPFYKKKGRNRSKSRHGSSQKSANKSGLNPSLDLLYLRSLERDLEQQTICLKQSPAIANTSSNHSSPKAGMHKREDSHQELIEKPESDNASSSSTREITSVHEDVQSVTYDSDGGGNSGLAVNEAVPVECHDDSSGDESFHSLVDTHSSRTRLSNASVGSLGEIPETSCTNLPKLSPSRPSTSKSLDISNSALNPDRECTSPPPPPPPPPPKHALPPSVRLTPRASSWSSRIRSKSSSFSKLSTSSSPRKSDYSPRKSDYSPRCNQTTQISLPSSPRKSPKPQRTSPSIPPPPCPPPIMKGNSSTPPPPPAGFPQYAPLGKDGTPLPKLKPLHWDKVRAAPDRNMVWDKIRSSSFELDEEMIESLFGYNLQTTVKNDEVKSKTPSPSKHVLEPKRLQNITILLKALNATAEQICDALIRGDGLSLQQLEALAKMVPTKEEESKLNGYKGDINELGSAERLVRALLSIPFAFLRVEAMLYRETFEDDVVHLRNSFSMLEEACKELRSSRLFLKLLEAVLKTGNRMNVGTIRGGARAFKLDTLLKLADVKGTDGRTTLLHFVVQEIIRSEGIRVSDSIMGKIDQKNKTKSPEEKEEDYRRMGLDLVAGLSTELYNVKKTATIDIDVLASSVSNLSDGMEKLKHLVTKNLSGDEKNGSFVESMKKFLNYAEKKLEKLKVDEDGVLLHVREITEYFHGHVSKDEANPLRIFVIVRDFLGMLDHVCKELRCFKVPSSPNPLAPFR